VKNYQSYNYIVIRNRINSVSDGAKKIAFLWCIYKQKHATTYWLNSHRVVRVDAPQIIV